MPNIRIFNKDQAIQFNVNGHTVILQSQGITEIDIADWVDIKNKIKPQIKNGVIGPENEADEILEINKFRGALQARFSRLGSPAVKIVLESGEFSSDGEKLEASEWLHRQEHEYKSEALAIAREANDIAKEAKSIAAANVEAATKQAKWAKLSAVIAVVAALISTASLIPELLDVVL